MKLINTDILLDDYGFCLTAPTQNYVAPNVKKKLN